MTSSSSLYGTVTQQNTSSANSTGLYGDANTPIPDASGNLVVRGDLYVLSGNILTTATTGNIFPTNATTLNIGGAATAVNIGAGSGTTTVNNNLVVDGSVTAEGADFGNITIAVVDDNTISTTSGNLNLDSATGVVYIDNATLTTGSGNVFLFNQNATQVDAFQAATTIVMGATTGNTTIRNKLNLSEIQATVGGAGPIGGLNLYSNDATNAIHLYDNYVQIVSGTGLGADWVFNEDGTTTFPSYTFPYADGTANQVLTTNGSGLLSFTDVGSLDTNYTIDASTTTGGTNFNLVGSDATTDTIKFANGTGVTVSRTSANEINFAIGQDVATTANPTFAGATLGAITVGVATNNTITTTSGQLILESATGEIDTGTTNILSTNSSSFLLLNSPTTVTAFNSATSLQLGANTGTTNINNDLLVDDNITVTGDLAVNGGDITTTSTTANLFTTAATTINIGGAGNGTSTGIINLGTANQTYITNVNSLIVQNDNTSQGTVKLLNQTSTSPILIASTSRRSIKCIVTINDDVTGDVHSVELLIVRKFSTSEAFVTIYAEVLSATPLATFTVVDSGTALELYATKASSNSTDIYVLRNSLGVSL